MGLYNRRHDSSPSPFPPTISVPSPYNHRHTRHESSPLLSISPPPRPPSPDCTRNINLNRRDSLPPSFPPNSPPATTSHYRRDSYPGPFPTLPSPSSSTVSEPPLPLYHNRRESCPSPFPFPISPYHESTDLSLLPSTSSSRNLNHRLLKRRLDIRNKDNYHDNNNGLIWPFYDIKFLDDDDIRETAYEVFFTACRSCPGFGGRSALTFYSKHESMKHESSGVGGMSPSSPVAQTSRTKIALGLKILKSSMSQRMTMRGSWTMSMSSPPSPVAEGSPRPRVLPRRIMTMAEVMRLQMGVSEQSDSRLRKTLMRTLVGQLGRQAETIILPLELLRHLKPSEFNNPHEYHLWQKRQLKILEAGLLLHPSIPVEKTNTFAMNLKEIIRSGELKPIDTSKNSETMRTFSNSVVSLSMRSPDGVPTNVCHWANGFPVNVHLYTSLLQSIFDLEDETLVLDEVDELLELMKKTWSTLGINRPIHNLCFAWTLFQQYVATGQREPELLCASHTVFNEVANDAKKEKEALYVNMLKSVLGSLQSWADKRLLNYHAYFQGESIRQIENLLPVVLLASKILGDVTISDGDWQNKGDFSAERVDDYIRSSLKNAFEMIIEAENAKSTESETKQDISEVMLDLAKDTEELAMKERRTYSPILKKWHTIAGAVAALTLNNCYGHVLKQYLSEMMKTITVELILVLQRARRLEDVLVQMVVQDSADCEDGGKTIVREMVPFEVDLNIMDLMKRWIDESLEKANVCLQRAKETETWNPKSKSEPYAKSVVELVNLAKKIVQDFFQIPIAITEDLVQELADGLHKIFKEYTMFIAACGLKENYIPSLPPLTRCNRNSKFHKLWKIASPCNVSCEDPHIYGIYESSHPHSCTSRGTQRLYIRLNTLHYLLSHISSLDKSLTLTQGVVPSDRLRCSTDINNTQGKSTSYFETVNNSISAACQHLSEVASYRLIFFDSNSFFYDSLYVGDVANARINNAVTILKHNIKLMTAILTERAQPSLIKEIMKACFHAFLFVLLAGGTTRMFNESDHMVIWFIIPATRTPQTDHKNNALALIVLLQYVPRLYLIFPLSSQIIKATGVVTKTAWAGAAYNLLLYMLASHVLGASWYLLSVDRYTTCWKSVCKKEDNPHSCFLYLDCSSLNNDMRKIWANSTNVFNRCDPNNDDIPFKYGLFQNALTKHVVSSNFISKYLYCLWWGLQQLSSYGQNLETSTFIGETSFAIVIAILGLVLFAHLIGNMQTYLQSITIRLEEWRLKRRDTEEWMGHRQLPEDLRFRVRRFVQYKWLATRGVDEETILRSLPTDLRRDIQRHLCLDLVRRVPFFSQMDDQLLDAICERLVSSLSTLGTYIVREGDPVTEMLFIIRGRLDSSTTNGGRTGFFNSIILRPGDFCGEELLSWALLPKSTMNLPSSTRTVKALSEVEAFALRAEDLKFVANQFRRLHSKKLQHTFRFYSHHWRTWAACFIQAAWRRYKKRMSAKDLGVRESLPLDETEATEREHEEEYPTGSNSSQAKMNLGVTILASRFAANTRRGALKMKDDLPKLRKPEEPDFTTEAEDD